MSAKLTLHRRGTLLLTGASGVVGSAVLPELTDYDVICLTHHREVDGARSVRGDLTQPRLGLGAVDYGKLAREVDAVVHCAAVTNFGAGAEATRDLNVRGTEEVLGLAAAAEAPLYHLSTAFVGRAELTRRSRGDADPQAAASPDEYLDSKRAAERAVRESGVEATIIRPSVVIGDSRSGSIRQFQGLHGIAGALLKNALPLVPLDVENRVDFVPQDLVARSIAGLVRSRASGGEHWITAGGDALTAGRMVEVCLETGRGLGLELIEPRLVSQDMVDRLIRPVFIEPLPDKARRKFDEMLAMTALFCTPEPFPCTCASIPGAAPLGAADLERSLVSSLVYLARAKGLVQVEAAA